MQLRILGGLTGQTSKLESRLKMSRKIIVENDSLRLRKVAAQCLVRRQIADWVIPNVSIRMRPIGQFNPVKDYQAAKPAKRSDYQHHIEPHIERFTWANNEWLAHLAGYAQISEL